MYPLLRFLVRGQRIDRRILYLLLMTVIALPFVIEIPTPPPAILPETYAFYRTIEEMAADPVRRNKLVILCTNYGAGTLAENQTQADAIARHLMKNRLRFAIFAFNAPQGREQGKIAAERSADRYGYQYGVDYVNWGYRPPDAIEPLLKAAVRDIPDAVGNDINGVPLEQIPVMQGIQTVNDVGLIIEVAAANTLPQWLQYFQRTGENPVPTLYAPTSVMAPEGFPFLKSGQLQGMLFGLRGANEYEVLIGERDFGKRGAASLAYSHLLIILLVVLGNIGMFAQQRMERLYREGNL
ncbi:MAG: hypothetical protein OHK0029_23230 [Armatimonadaceae bacterium]